MVLPSAEPGRTSTARRLPVGVVGVIAPCNYPLTNGFGDCIPAMMAGNTVVLKPSEVTPLSSLLIAEARARSQRMGREARQMASDIEQNARRHESQAAADLATGRAALLNQIDELTEFAVVKDGVVTYPAQQTSLGL